MQIMLILMPLIFKLHILMMSMGDFMVVKIVTLFLCLDFCLILNSRHAFLKNIYQPLKCLG